MEFIIQADEKLPMENINNHLRNVISNNIHKDLSLVNINESNLEEVSNVGAKEYNMNREAKLLIRAMDVNTVSLWTPDFQNRIEAIALDKVKFQEDGEEYDYDGIRIEKLNLEKGLKIDRDYSGDS